MPGDPLRTCVPFLPGLEFTSAVADGGAEAGPGPSPDAGSNAQDAADD